MQSKAIVEFIVEFIPNKKFGFSKRTFTAEMEMMFDPIEVRMNTEGIGPQLLKVFDELSEEKIQELIKFPVEKLLSRGKLKIKKDSWLIKYK